MHVVEAQAVIQFQERVQQEDGEARAYGVPVALARPVPELSHVVGTQYSILNI